MFKLILFLLLESILILSNVSDAKAADTDVVINEFSAATSSDDWVEIYNKSGETINIKDWVLRDSTDSNKKSLTGSICANSTRKFDFSNYLNVDGDTIKLLTSESSSSPVSTIIYYSSSVPEHQSGQSTSRSPDGSDTWQLLTSPTGNDNTSCNPSPTPTPSPSPTPTPTPAPTPASSPATSPTSAATPASPKPKSPSPSASVLGESTPASQLASPSPSPDPENSSGSKTKLAFIITGSGIFLIALSGAFYFMYKRLDKTEKTTSDE